VSIILIFQLWCFDHLLICNSKFNIGITKFSCLLHWMNVKVGDNVIRSVFDKDVVSVYHGILFDLVHFWIRFILNKLSPCT